MSVVREFRLADREAIKTCIVELQNYERKIEPNRREGSSICEKYVERILKNCSEQNGKIFVAEDGDGDVVGFCSVWIERKLEELISTVTEYTYISDLVILPSYRGKGFGEALLAAAEKHARHSNVNTIMINALTKNVNAIEVYKKTGFQEYETLLKKELVPTENTQNSQG